jgi:hypothetical protein
LPDRFTVHPGQQGRLPAASGRHCGGIAGEQFLVPVSQGDSQIVRGFGEEPFRADKPEAGAAARRVRLQQEVAGMGVTVDEHCSLRVKRGSPLGRVADGLSGGCLRAGPAEVCPLPGHEGR